ncbi:hypothetical protein QOT17_001404 [Balamuthia mandrillaris]
MQLVPKAVLLWVPNSYTWSKTSPYSKVGTVESRSVVVSGKDIKKEKVCQRIFELGLKHIRWVGKARIEEAQKEGKLLWKPKEQRNMEKRKEKEKNIETVALDSSLELSGITLAEEEYYGAASWSDIVDNKGEETQ